MSGPSPELRDVAPSQDAVTTPGVSVVIPTHRRRDGLQGLLADLSGQTGLADPLQVVVVNSPEGEDVTDVVEAARGRGLDVVLVMTDNAIGHKRNEGARAATGELLVFFDDDMRLDPGVVAAHVAAHAGRPDTIICGSVTFPDEWVAQSNYYRFKNSRHLNALRAADFSPVAANNIVTMNLSLPRELFWRLDGFDARFRRYGGEDVEFGFRAVRAGVPMLLSLAANAWHVEVQLDVVGYCRKLYTNAYHSTPRVLQQNPEAGRVPTWRWTETDVALGGLDRALRGITGVLARPHLVAGLARLLRATDGQRWLYLPLPYKVLTILAQRVAADDRRSRRAARPELFS